MPHSGLLSGNLEKLKFAPCPAWRGEGGVEVAEFGALRWKSPLRICSFLWGAGSGRPPPSPSTLPLRTVGGRSQGEPGDTGAKDPLRFPGDGIHLSTNTDGPLWDVVEEARKPAPGAPGLFQGPPSSPDPLQASLRGGSQLSGTG